MSTKTTFKRIALVAVAALGLGTISVAPSSAAVLVGSATNTLATVSSSSAITAGETATLTFTSTWVASAAQDSVSVAAYATSSNSPEIRLYVSDSSTSVAGSVRVVNAGSAATAGTTAQVGLTAAAAVTVTYKALVYAPTTAGTYNISIYASKHDAGVATGTAYTTPLTWSFTVAAKNTVPAANSTVTVRSGYVASGTASPFSGTAEGTDSSTASTATKSITGSTPAASIFVVEKNATSTADESITVTASGSAAYLSLSGTSRPTAGTALTVKNGDAFYVWSTGTAGPVTVTMLTPSLALGTKTINFFGSATKLAVSTAVAPKTVIYTKAGTSTDNVAVIKVTDSNGFAVTSAQTFTCTPSDTLQIASCSVNGTYSSTYGGFVLSTVSAAGTSGKAVTLTVTIADPADTTGVAKLTTTHAVTMGGAVAKEVISFDKASYSAGEQMIIKITATDASGNPVYTGATAPVLSSNKAIQGLATVATSYTAGVADSVSRDVDNSILNSYQAFAPAAGGEFKVYATGTDALATIISATATVVDGTTEAANAATDAANEATDAANAATDAALAAADAADAATAAAQDASDAVAALSATVAKLVASLKAQITSLTNLVIKIQKKVKA